MILTATHSMARKIQLRDVFLLSSISNIVEIAAISTHMAMNKTQNNAVALEWDASAHAYKMIGAEIK